MSSSVGHDLYSAFFIAPDEYWRASALDHQTVDMKFTLNAGNVHALLYPFVGRILKAFKFLGVLFDCDVDVEE